MRRDVRVRTPTGQQFAGKNITKLPPAAPAIQKKKQKKGSLSSFSSSSSS
jgi:hypothetical protein